MAESEYSLYIVRCRDGSLYTGIAVDRLPSLQRTMYRDGSLYTGIAVDVTRRIQQHESGVQGAKYLRGKGPLRLEFVQPVGDRAAASRIEYQVKRLGKDAKEDLIAGRHSLIARCDQASGGASG